MLRAEPEAAPKLSPNTHDTSVSCSLRQIGHVTLLGRPWNFAALSRYGLDWDGEVVWQSRRLALYDEALERLRARDLAYDCACSRAELQRAASAPLGAEAVYPGTCRGGLAPGRVARAVRFRVPPGVIAFDDAIAGHLEEDVEAVTGDFVIKRADGPFAYQLAVVVDDAAQGVTQVVRGGDLLSSTARQIVLQRALGLPTPDVEDPNFCAITPEAVKVMGSTRDHNANRSRSLRAALTCDSTVASLEVIL